MTCPHGITGDPAVPGAACPYCESRDRPDYVRRARFRCRACAHEWIRGPSPGAVGFADNLCPRCGHDYSTWLNHPLNRERTA